MQIQKKGNVGNVNYSGHSHKLLSPKTFSYLTQNSCLTYTSLKYFSALSFLPELQCFSLFMERLPQSQENC